MCRACTCTRSTVSPTVAPVFEPGTNACAYPSLHVFLPPPHTEHHPKPQAFFIINLGVPGDDTNRFAYLYGEGADEIRYACCTFCAIGTLLTLPDMISSIQRAKPAANEDQLGAAMTWTMLITVAEDVPQLAINFICESHLFLFQLLLVLCAHNLTICFFLRCMFQ